MRVELCLSGFGGQGIGLAGYILGRAFSLHQDLEAVMTQSYGPEARGGASSANIVVADRPIDYPFVQQADILVALSQEAYTRFRPEAKEEATILIDSDLVTPVRGDHTFAIPATALAEQLGRRIVANMVMLGFLAAQIEFVDPSALKDSIQASVRPKTLPLNLEAFEAGLVYQAQKEHTLE